MLDLIESVHNKGIPRISLIVFSISVISGQLPVFVDSPLAAQLKAIKLHSKFVTVSQLCLESSFKIIQMWKVRIEAEMAWRSSASREAGRSKKAAKFEAQFPSTAKNSWPKSKKVRRRMRSWRRKEGGNARIDTFLDKK